MKIPAIFALLAVLCPAVWCGPSYTKTAHVFISQTTAEGYHVGDQVCYSTKRSLDCFPGVPRREYRFEMEDGTFSTLFHPAFHCH